jgi:hypothetical protein
VFAAGRVQRGSGAIGEDRFGSSCWGHDGLHASARSRPEPDPEFCPLPEDSSGPGSFVAKGPCEFQQRAPVSCEATGDDLIVAVPRKAKNGASLVIYLNVEHYHGPGAYEGAQIFVAVESGEIIYRWSNDEVRATVGPDEAFVAISRTQLDQEPVRVACSRLIGPESNYTYQCAGTSGAIDSAAEIFFGKLQCRSRRAGAREGR